MQRRFAATCTAALLGLTVQVDAHEEHGRSLEADELAERLEGVDARKAAKQRIRWRDRSWRRDPTVEVKLLGINDFHGRLSPSAVGSRPAGGAAVLAAYLKDAAARAAGPAFIIHAGDHVGASPPNSALLQDEPAIDVLNLLANDSCRPLQWQRRLPDAIEPFVQPRCNIVGTLGNHEFDEGAAELLRLIAGGSHPDGPFLDRSWRGAHFPYVSANVIQASTGKPLLPAYTVKMVNGVRIGLIGAVLKETPTIVTPSGVAGLEFIDEAQAINASVAELKRAGIRSIVVTIHQGIRQSSYTGPTQTDIQGLNGPIVDIIKRLDDEVDVVISGHAHGFTNALVANENGKEVLVTQAFSSGTAYGDIELSISRKSGDVVESLRRS